MGRALKRVPMDFDYPLGTIWSGYDASASIDKVDVWKNYDKNKGICTNCDLIHNNCSESASYCLYNPR